MKLTIHQELGIPETEIIINCAHMDARVQHLISLIRQHSFFLTGYQEEKLVHTSFIRISKNCIINTNEKNYEKPFI